MFHFFLISAGLLINAFSLLIRSGDPKYQAFAFILLCIGGILSTMFVSLDIRNTQLLEQSEALLRKIEKDSLYGDWRDKIDGADIKLGILSREAVLKDYVDSCDQIRCGPLLRWIWVDNIKHKFAIRSMEIIAIVSFWIFAYETAPPATTVQLYILEVDVKSLIAVGLGLCLIWTFHALRSPSRHRRWEQEALKATDARDRLRRTGNS